MISAAWSRQSFSYLEETAATRRRRTPATGRGRALPALRPHHLALKGCLLPAEGRRRHRLISGSHGQPRVISPLNDVVVTACALVSCDIMFAYGSRGDLASSRAISAPPAPVRRHVCLPRRRLLGGRAEVRDSLHTPRGARGQSQAALATPRPGKRELARYSVSNLLGGELVEVHAWRRRAGHPTRRKGLHVVRLQHGRTHSSMNHELSVPELMIN